MEESRKRVLASLLWTAGIAASALAVACLIGQITGAFRIGRVGAQTRVEINQHRSFPAASVDSVTIGAVSEAIRISEASDGQFGVHFTGTAITADESAVPELEAGVQRRSLAVRVHHKPTAVAGLHLSDLVLEVVIPAGYSGGLSVESISGSIDVVPHTYRSFAARTTSGAIYLNTARATSVSARSVSGSVTARKIAADRVFVETTSGRIEIETSAPSLELRSVSGSVRASSSTSPAMINVDSTSGSVMLRLPADSRFRLDARSTSGSIRCDFPISTPETARPGHHRISGWSGSPSSGDVRIRTTSGSIAITR